jgi:phage N-6-adenine-methyltransferase
MTGRAMGSHHLPNGGLTDVWLTPPEIIKALGPFDLDPCAATDAPWPTADRHYTEADDGLAQEWAGLVWCNPPYRQVWTWLDRLASHPDGGVALIFARTETRGFVSEVWAKADSLLFLEGRLFFHRPDGERAKANAGAPSVLVAYGSEGARRLATCHLDGYLVETKKRMGLAS